MPEDISQFGMGRRITTDPRDKGFLAKSLLQEPITDTFQYWNANGWWGDQGYTPQCVGYSFSHAIEDGPTTHKGKGPIIGPVEIYNEAQKIDEWEGEGYDGTSVRAGAKYLQKRGIIEQYAWAWDLDTLIRAVLTKGPAVVGTYWYENMFFPDEKGIIKVGGYIAGGHAYVVNGINIKTRLFRIKNSWGRGWGKKGFAYISFDDMEKLIHEEGEICLPLENKIFQL